MLWRPSPDEIGRETTSRELRNVIRLCVDLAPGPVIDAAVLGRVFEVRGDPSSETPILPELQVAPGSLLQIDQAALSQLIGSTPEDAPKEKRPWALLQREFGGTLITETLRQTRWKLRPAARILGISPVKLRQDFRLWIEHLLDDSQQDHSESGDQARHAHRTADQKAGRSRHRHRSYGRPGPVMKVGNHPGRHSGSRITITEGETPCSA